MADIRRIFDAIASAGYSLRARPKPKGRTMKEHRWTTGDGVEHVAYQCDQCKRWFDSPSVHGPTYTAAVDAATPVATPVDTCSLDGCPHLRPHYHRGDDEIVWTEEGA